MFAKLCSMIRCNSKLCGHGQVSFTDQSAMFAGDVKHDYSTSAFIKIP